MSNILTDIEKGAVVLYHELASDLTNPADIPPGLVPAVEKMAENIGLDVTGLSPTEAAWVFDLLHHSVDALTSAQEAPGHAQAGAEQAPAPVAPEQPAQAAQVAETEVSVANPTGTLPPHSEQGAEHVAAVATAQAAAETGAGPDTSHLDSVIAKAQQEFGGPGGTPAA